MTTKAELLIELKRVTVSRELLIVEYNSLAQTFLELITANLEAIKQAKGAYLRYSEFTTELIAEEKAHGKTSPRTVAPKRAIAHLPSD
ncbi:MAG: hypothetical protein DRH97_01435 [Chloroflexi bacterium]|nr:MAG: hypothetical protein DRH97_01435 [Chloroflexota bacterium]